MYFYKLDQNFVHIFKSNLELVLIKNIWFELYSTNLGTIDEKKIL